MSTPPSSQIEKVIPFIVAGLGLLSALAIALTQGPRIVTILLLTIATVALVAGVLRLRGERQPSATLTPVPPRVDPPVAAVLPSVVEPAPPPTVPAPPIAPPTPTVPIYLPAPRQLVIGREQELDMLIAAFRRTSPGTATAIIGPSGAGKNTIITQAIDYHLEEGTFPDGCSWHLGTEYHGDGGMRRLLIEILDRFGGPAVAMTTTLRMGERAVADLIRGKRILFWLDDVPEDFPLLRALTALTAANEAGVGPTLVISSRQDWAIPEVNEIVIETPQLDEALDQLREWMAYCGRETNSDDYDALKAICVNLSCLPLALRQAAGYAGLQNPRLPKLAADLGSAVYPPGDLARTARETTRFVEAALFPQARRAFAALAIFEEPRFDLDAACAVAASVTGSSVETMQSDIETMVRLGLLEADGDEYQPQVRVHPVVRSFMQQRMEEAGPELQARARATLSSIIKARRGTTTAITASEAWAAVSNITPIPLRGENN